MSASPSRTTEILSIFSLDRRSFFSISKDCLADSFTGSILPSCRASYLFSSSFCRSAVLLSRIRANSFEDTSLESVSRVAFEVTYSVVAPSSAEESALYSSLVLSSASVALWTSESRLCARRLVSWSLFSSSPLVMPEPPRLEDRPLTAMSSRLWIANSISLRRRSWLATRVLRRFFMSAISFSMPLASMASLPEQSSFCVCFCTEILYSKALICASVSPISSSTLARLSLTSAICDSILEDSWSRSFVERSNSSVSSAILLVISDLFLVFCWTRLFRRVMSVCRPFVL